LTEAWEFHSKTLYGRPARRVPLRDYLCYVTGRRVTDSVSEQYARYLLPSLESSSQMILLYASDPTLLNIRRLILERLAHCKVQCLSTGCELRAELERTDQPYALLFICHSVPDGGHSAARYLARQKGIPVYELKRLCPPDEWTAEVCRILHLAPE